MNSCSRRNSGHNSRSLGQLILPTGTAGSPRALGIGGGGEPKETLISNLVELMEVVTRLQANCNKGHAIHVTLTDFKKLKTLVKEANNKGKSVAMEAEKLAEENVKMRAVQRSLEAKVQEKRKYISNSRKGEAKEDVERRVALQVKNNLFWVRKFLRQGKEAMDATGLIYDNIKEELRLDIDRDDFCEIYHPCVNKCLSDRRMYVQTRAEIAVQSECLADLSPCRIIEH
jgi:hypothetical protein